jgi:hypothetical protein
MGAGGSVSRVLRAAARREKEEATTGLQRFNAPGRRLFRTAKPCSHNSLGRGSILRHDPDRRRLFVDEVVDSSIWQLKKINKFNVPSRLALQTIAVADKELHG